MSARTFKAVVSLAFLLLFIIIILASPAFAVVQVNISGNSKLSEDYILKTTSLEKPANIFAFSALKTRKELLKNPYVAEAVIEKDYWERTIDIRVKERMVSGYVEYLSAYLYIDESGRVLEVSTSMKEKLPVVVGLKCKPFMVGELLDVENKNSFNNLVILAHLINKYDLLESVVKVSLQDEYNTHLYVNNIDVELGDIRDADEKIGTIKDIIASLEDENVKGFLDIRDVTRPARFKFLT